MEHVPPTTSGDPPHPFPSIDDRPEKAPVLIRLIRLRSIMNCLGSALVLDGSEYSSHIGERSAVCDLVADELSHIYADLAEGVI